MTKGEQAKEYFYGGLSCAQSMAKTFAEYIPMPEGDFVKLCSSFGGGMGRLRQTCGAVTVPFMIIGALYGYGGAGEGGVKAAHYGRVQEFARRFEAKYGTILCGELLKRGVKPESCIPDPRTPAYYASRPCGAIIEYAADLLEEYIKEQSAL